jgi:hypothetical protein
VRGDLEKARRAEVRDLEHVVRADQDVRRAQIPVQHALPVRVIDGVADLAGEIQRARHIDGALHRDDVLERLALHVLHHDEEDVVLLLGSGDGDDVGMGDAREQTRLAQELAEIQILAMRNFDGDFLVDPRVLRQVYAAEPSAAEGRDDPVLAERLASEEQWETYEPDAARDRVGTDADGLPLCARRMGARSGPYAQRDG